MTVRRERLGEAAKGKFLKMVFSGSLLQETLCGRTLALFKSTGFDPTPRVRFEDEEGIDAGGLRMEYFTLLMKLH